MKRIVELSVVKQTKASSKMTATDELVRTKKLNPDVSKTKKSAELHEKPVAERKRRTERSKTTSSNLGPSAVIQKKKSQPHPHLDLAHLTVVAPMWTKAPNGPNLPAENPQCRP